MKISCATLRSPLSVWRDSSGYRPVRAGLSCSPTAERRAAFSPRNNAVAEGFAGHGIATLLFDLLTEEEESESANVCSTSRCWRGG